MKEWRLKPFLFSVLVVFNALFLLLFTAFFFVSALFYLTRQISEVRLEKLSGNLLQLSERFQQIEDTALSISTHEMVGESFVRNEYTDDVYDSIVVRRKISEWLNKYTYIMPYISSIQIYSDKFLFVPPKVGGRNNIIAPTQDIPWRKHLPRLDGQDAIWIPANQIVNEENREETVLTYVLKVYGKEGTIAGYIAINLAGDSLNKYFFNENGYSAERFIGVVDGEGHPLLELSTLQQTEYLRQTVREQVERLDSDTGFKTVKAAGKSYMLIHTVHQSSGLQLIEFISADELFRDMGHVRNAMLAIGLIALLLTFPVASYLASRIIRPVPSLLRGFREIEDGRFEHRLGSYFIAEMNEISQSFNHMAGRLRQLLEELKKEHRIKREMEIKVLQAQINPHFLYNTLDTMNWMACRQGNDDLSRMAARLARLFRVSVSKGSTFIMLCDELEHAKAYAQIQQIRFKDRFEYMETIDDSLKECYLPKIIIQPFIENSILHGFGETMEQKAVISVKVERMDDASFRIVVDDNGLGMENTCMGAKEKLNSLYVSGSSGYGIQNVHDRIQMYFGRRYGVHLHNKGEREGVRVTIVLPILGSLEQLESRLVK